jgi:hypothetical protein
MSKPGTYKVVLHTTEVIKEVHDKTDGASAEIATDILTRAIMNAPKASGALVRSGRVKRLSDSNYTVIFGDNSVKYAYRRHEENKKNPQTLHYLDNAGESVGRGNLGKYFR